ncbi:ATP phosphoribosyltransferase regulatory subunit [Kordiimonas sp.]|uniref:ATP phosphoribosyltransferase regulatory subunit n=1 Tax=Kordiimonas sp. TaxID=1970157 RepID=UPI003A8D0624
MNGPRQQMAGSTYARQALLPEGFRDQLSPVAEQEDMLVRGLVDSFLSHGYDRVAPPLVEYEDSLLVGPGATRAKQLFRLMDPDTQRMMAIRADMTIQMARLAATRLADAPRPLRLAYSGNVLRTKGSQMRPDRQFVQAGVELVGATSLEAELEVIVLAVEALEAVGLVDVSLDLTVAPLVAQMCDSHKLTGDVRDMVFAALDAKDIGALVALSGNTRTEFETLLNAAGPGERAVEILRGLELKGAPGKLIARLGRLLNMVCERFPKLSVTIDPCESHGFEYKSGIGFAFFSKGGEGELGRGGRYLVTHPDGRTEEATGFSVYLDTLLKALPEAGVLEKIYLPHGVDSSVGVRLRAEGGRTLQALSRDADAVEEAARLGCSHIFLDDQIKAV